MFGKILKNFNNPNLKPISGMDSTFLYIETPTTPMHIGGVSVIEGDLDFETFKKTIQSRIHMIPKLRKRLVYVPMSIDYPYWVDDPNFDIDLHLNHIALPKPGSWNELRKISSNIFSEPLDQSRPLWSFTFVEGLDNVPQVPKGSVAMISKIHHVAIDGVAGAGILSLIFDFSPEKKEIPEPRPFKPQPLPNELKMVMKSAVTFAQNPLKLPKLLTQTLQASIKTGMLTRVQKNELPAAPFTAPPTPLNGIVAARRKWNCAILDLARVKKLKTLADTTLNDVVLAFCAGALRRYLDEKKKLPHKPLVAMVPISTRGKEAKEGDIDNQISSMLVQLATNVADPIERLEAIHENTLLGKTYQKAMGAKALSNMAEAVPFGIANQAARLYTRFQISEMHNPVFNVTITNVPGPQFPLYINGHKLLSVMGMAPIIDGMGLIITIFSYNGLLMISPTSDINSMPDLDDFTRYIRESANELEAAMLKRGKKKAAKKKPKKAKSDALFLHFKKELKASAKHIKPNNGVFQFHVTGAVENFWRVDLDKSPAVVRRGKVTNPDATFVIADEHLMKIGMGKMNLQTAFIQGRLKIDGDSSKAMKLGTIISKLPKLT